MAARTRKELEILLSAAGSQATRDSLKGAIQEVGDPSLRSCPECGNIGKRTLKNCPGCGHTFSKFGAQKTVCDGMQFDSRLEADIWLELKLRERAGEISNLCRQEPLKFAVNDDHVFTYSPDYTYEEKGQTIYLDAKGIKTAVFMLKMRCLLASGIVVYCIGKDRKIGRAVIGFGKRSENSGKRTGKTVGDKCES